MFDQAFLNELSINALYLGFWLVAATVALYVLRFLVHSILRVSSRSIPANGFTFVVRLIIVAYIFSACTDEIVNGFQIHLGEPFFVVIWGAYIVFAFFFSVSSVTPMREAWSYTRNGPLMSRGYIDVFYPWALIVLFPVLHWQGLKFGMIREEVFKIPVLFVLAVVEGIQTIGVVSNEDDIARFQKGIYILFGLFLAYHLVRGLFYSRDYVVNLAEVLRGDAPQSDLVVEKTKAEPDEETKAEEPNEPNSS